MVECTLDIEIFPFSLHVEAFFHPYVLNEDEIGESTILTDEVFVVTLERPGAVRVLGGSKKLVFGWALLAGSEGNEKSV